MGTKIETRKILSNAMMSRKPFKRGNISGAFITDTHSEFGQLPWSDASFLRHDIVTQNGCYVVFSYKTPIAWYNGTMWTIPDVTYSVSTTHHQHLVRVESDNPGFYAKF